MAAEARLSGGGKLSTVHLDPKRKRLKPFPAFPQFFPFSAIFWSNLTGLFAKGFVKVCVYSSNVHTVE
jgi:hypothetical protein